MKSFALALALTLSALSTVLRADDAPVVDQPVMQLGTVQVHGNEKIMATLRAIKLALKSPFSNDPAHADDPVCRIEKSLGEAREYLNCATNRDYIKRRAATQLSVETGTLGVPGGADLLRSFLAQEPDHRIHMAVKGAGLQALLAQIPDAPAEAPAAATSAAPKSVPAAATQKAPASATAQPATQW